MRARTLVAWAAVAAMLAVTTSALPACQSTPTTTPPATATTPVKTTTTAGDAEADTVPAAPAQASLQPAEGDTGVVIEPTLAWDVVAGATSYEIRIAVANGIAVDSSAEDLFAVPGYGVNTTANTHTVTIPLDYGTTYHWRVRAINANGPGPGAASSFATEDDPARAAAPLPTETSINVPLRILSPLDGATDIANRPTFSWEDRITATRYEFIIAEDTGRENPFATIIHAASTTTNSHAAAVLLSYGTTYNWRVRPVSSSETGPWVVSSFTTEARLDAPALTSLAPPPGDTDVDINPALSWEAVEDASDYELVIAEVPLQGNPFAVIDHSATSAYPEHTVWSALKFSTEYDWRVRARDEDGGVGPWATSSFTTEPDLSLLSEGSLTPAPNETGVPIEPTFGWNEVLGTTGYEFAISEDAGQDDPFATIEYSASLIANSYAIPDEQEFLEFHYATSYHWRVRAVNDVSGAGPWVTSYFTIEPDPVPLGIPVTQWPAFGETGVGIRPIFSWAAVDRATGYEIEITRGSFSAADYTATTLPNFYLVAEDLEYDTTYEWRVRAVSDSGPGPWSTSYFTIEFNPALPEMPSSLLPSFAATDVSIRPTFDWATVDRATGYEIEISRSAFLVIDYTATTVSNFYVVAEDLEDDTTYFWRVRAVSASGRSPWSTSYFTTEAAP